MTDVYRDVLRKTVAVTLKEVGFSSASQIAIESLVEMIQSLILSLSESTKNYMELANRTQPVATDVFMALLNNGIKFDDLINYTFRNREIIVNFKKENINSHPEHLKLPPLPKRYTYERTPSYVKPPTDHEELRCKAAYNKRGTESAYARFLSRTAENKLNLFGDKNDKNFLISLDSHKNSSPIYLLALMPCDQLFDFDELEYYYQQGVTQEYENDYLEFEISPKPHRRNSVKTTASSIDSIDITKNPFAKLIK